jgi:hypothetical protein
MNSLHEQFTECPLDRSLLISAIENTEDINIDRAIYRECLSTYDLDAVIV